jgi:hypothetical protein
MRFISSRAAIAASVTLVTVVVCSFGIRAELRAANYSVLDHLCRSTPGEKAIPALGRETRGTDSAPL